MINIIAAINRNKELLRDYNKAKLSLFCYTKCSCEKVVINKCRRALRHRTLFHGIQ